MTTPGYTRETAERAISQWPRLHELARSHQDPHPLPAVLDHWPLEYRIVLRLDLESAHQHIQSVLTRAITAWRWRDDLPLDDIVRKLNYACSAQLVGYYARRGRALMVDFLSGSLP